MKTLNSKIICLVMAACSFVACKKDNKEPIKPEPEKPMVVAIDGKEYTVDKNAVKTTHYTDAGASTSAVDVTVPLDNTGRTIKFYIADLKTATISLSSKIGTSAWVKTGSPLQVNSAAKTVMATPISNFSQSYVQYSFTGNSFFGTDGKIELKYNASTGDVSYTWSVTFKDAAGKTFTTSGGYEFNIKTATLKPLSAIVDPTPVSAKPTIENITPAAGLEGTQVTIAGTNFSTQANDNVVTFNGIRAEIKSATETGLVVIAPTSSTGKVAVKVKNSDLVEGPLYTYQAMPTVNLLNPNTGKAGDKITITGSNFSTVTAENEVWFTAASGTVKASVTTATNAALTVEVPANTITGPVKVTVKGLAAVSSNNIFTIASTEQPNTLGLTTLFSYTSNKYITDDDGNSFVFEDLSVKKFDKNGQLTKTFKKEDFPGHNAGFTTVTFGLDKDVNVYVYLVGYEGATKHTNVFKIERNTNRVTVLRNMANFSDEGFAGSPKLTSAKHFYVDADENIIFIDNNWVNNTAYSVLKINKANVISVLVDKTKLTTDGNAGAPHGANSPDITFDAEENMYVASISDNKTYGNVFSILKFDKALNKSVIYRTGVTGGMKQAVIDQGWSMNINQMINLDYRLRVSRDGKKLYLAQTYGIYKIDTETKKIDLFGKDITILTDFLNQPLRVANFFYAENAGKLIIYNGTIDGSPSKAQSVLF